MTTQFRVNATDENVVVTLDGTAYMVNYRRGNQGLALSYTRGDSSAPIHALHFLARASQLANAKAQELGWFAA
jgi:hypothetical protein